MKIINSYFRFNDDRGEIKGIIIKMNDERSIKYHLKKVFKEQIIFIKN